MTAVEWFYDEVDRIIETYDVDMMRYPLEKAYEKAKEMEREQIGYSKEDVLTAGEMGEINTYDTKHIASYLDEAKQFNQK